MTTTSTTSSIISSLGAGSGVDMGQLAVDLAEARFLDRINAIQTRSETLDARISAASTLKNQLSELASALGDRIRSGDLAPTAVIGRSDVASASVASGTSVSGTYSLEVLSLAKAQTLASNAYSSSTSLVGEGQLTIRFGAASTDSFTEDSAKAPLFLDISATDTLATVAQKINASEQGVSAYVVNSADGARLVLKGADGEANGFVIEASGASVTGNPAAGSLDYLAWNPSIDSGQRSASASDAQIRLDGVLIKSASNTVSGLPSGLTVTLTGTNSGSPTTISFADKSGEITSLMTDFTAALNDIAASLAELAAPLGGDLGNDSGARSMKQALSSLTSTVIMPNAATGEPQTLGDLGLSINRDGTFSFDSARLTKALAASPKAVGAMFTTGLYGVYGTIDKLARNVAKSSNPGSLGGSVERYTAQKSRLDAQMEKISQQQERLKEQMVKTFTWADVNVSSSQSTLSFIKSQIAAWNADSD